MFFIPVIQPTLILLLSAADFSPLAVAAVAKYWMTRLVFTVFPAPDSPLVINVYIQRNAVSGLITMLFFERLVDEKLT